MSFCLVANWSEREKSAVFVRPGGAKTAEPPIFAPTLNLGLKFDFVCKQQNTTYHTSLLLQSFNFVMMEAQHKGIFALNYFQLLENAKKGKCGPHALFQALAKDRVSERDLDHSTADAMEALLELWNASDNVTFHPDAVAVMKTWTGDMIADVRLNGGSIPSGSFWNCHLLQRYNA